MPDASPPGIFFDTQKGLLKVAVEKERFRSVMEEVKEKTGVEILISEAVEDSEVTDQFDYLPLEEGLRRLLKGRSYAMFRSGDKRRVLKVRILSSGEFPILPSPVPLPAPRPAKESVPPPTSPQATQSPPAEPPAQKQSKADAGEQPPALPSGE